MFVDHKAVFVPDSLVAVHVRMRLGTVPVVMLMLVMLIVIMRVLMLHGFVLMRQHFSIIARPAPECDKYADNAKRQ